MLSRPLENPSSLKTRSVVNLVEKDAHRVQPLVQVVA